MNYDDEQLDRALFALEFEEPPAGLRSRILAATVYRTPVPVRTWEIAAIGALAAVVVWLAIVLVQGVPPAPVARAGDAISSALSEFARIDVMMWLAIGASAAFWISQLNLTVLPGASRTARR